jgi:phage terminase large subunit GpA-like protein
MARCEVCGNEYDKAFEVRMDGETHTFDSFECAIHALAPMCAHCRCRIVGHGMESNGRYYCCAHCAHQHGVAQVSDRPQGDEHARETHDVARPKGEEARQVRFDTGR